MLLILAALGPGTARAAALIIDQSNLPGSAGGSVLWTLITDGQTFTPALTSIGFIELGLYDGNLDPPTTMRIDLRDGGPGGSVIASSAEFVVENDYTMPLDMLELTRVEFDPPIAVVPGNTYFIELIYLGGGEGWWSYGSAYAGGTAHDDGVPYPNDLLFRTGLVVPSQATTAPELPVEYTDSPDDRAIFGGGDHDEPDPGQVLYTQPPDGSLDLLPFDVDDFSPATESGTSALLQVDALASQADAYVDELLANGADLVLSVAGDGTTGDIATFYETPSADTGVHLLQIDMNALEALPGEIDDVDALELWGPVNGADAVYFSLFDDLSSGTSVYRWSGGSAVPWISHADIVTAVTALGFSGSPQQVDVDALLVENGGDEQNFDVGDGILFSIREGGNFDGGEIIHLRVGAAPRFLEHAGHLWDTAFAVAANLPGAGKDDVDALEARPATSTPGPFVPSVPAMSPWGYAAMIALLCGVGVLGRLRRSVRAG